MRMRIVRLEHKEERRKNTELAATHRKGDLLWQFGHPAGNIIQVGGLLRYY